MMENRKIIDLVNQKFGNNVNFYEDTFHLLNIVVPGALNVEVVTYLSKTPELGFNFLTDLTAVHYPFHKDAELMVTYLLYNMPQNIHVRIKSYLPIKEPKIKTLTPIFSAANWLERECYDFFGVIFEGHPNLTRIMNVEEMDYYPLRKEYAVEDMTRKDKDDLMFGRDNGEVTVNFNVIPG